MWEFIIWGNSDTWISFTEFTREILKAAGDIREIPMCLTDMKPTLSLRLFSHTKRIPYITGEEEGDLSTPGSKTEIYYLWGRYRNTNHWLLEKGQEIFPFPKVKWTVKISCHWGRGRNQSHVTLREG